MINIINKKSSITGEPQSIYAKYFGKSLWLFVTFIVNKFKKKKEM